MAYEDDLREIAQRLKLKRSGSYYWRLFTRIEALMGWLHHQGQCVYCGVSLIDASLMIGGLVGTDHLLPKHAYPELDFTDRRLAFRDYLNAVPACNGCNCLKRSWDPNTKVQPQLYKRGEDIRLNCDMQVELIQRAKQYVAEERKRRNTTHNQDQNNWLAALGEMNTSSECCEKHSRVSNGENEKTQVQQDEVSTCTESA